MAHHKREPLARGLGRETLREQVFAHVPPEVFRSSLASLEADGRLIADKEVVRAKEHTLELSSADSELRDRLEELFQTARLEPPSPDAALQQAALGKADVKRMRRILQLLFDSGNLVRLQPELVFHRQALDELIKKLRAHADKHEPDRSIDVASFKDLAGVSRKYAIPLLEFLDRERITQRQGDRRIILKAVSQRE